MIEARMPGKSEWVIRNEVRQDNSETRYQRRTKDNDSSQTRRNATTENSLDGMRSGKTTQIQSSEYDGDLV